VTAATILRYRVIQFWLPRVFGAAALVSPRRGLQDPAPADLGDPLLVAQAAP
jgi:hypothetical protein